MSPRPLFAPERPASTHSDERADEEDALLGNRRSNTAGQHGFWRELGLFAWAVCATATVIVLAVIVQHQSVSSGETSNPKAPSAKKNLIFMVSDGMGPASLSLTRSFRQYKDKLPIDDVLVLDQHFIGSSRTRSSNSLVTDSAAGATAFSCGEKSYNGAISVLPDHTACGTVLEAAKRAGYMTGLVVTTSITDATPACFASHVKIRSEEDLIAEQEVGNNPLGRVVDLMFGGGRCHFLPNGTTGGCREDTQDITKLAQEKYGWNYIDSRTQFDDISHNGSIQLPLLGLFADYNFPYEIDRQTMSDVYPSLEEMASTAIRALEAATADSEQGFFLMIEGSRIDHAGHGNDPAAQVHEVLAYDKAFSKVIEFLESSSDNGVLVATSDHETGGLSTARQLHSTYPEYLWHPEVLDAASHSSEYLAQKLNEEISYNSRKGKDYINQKYVKKGLGIQDATDAELQLIVDDPTLAVYYFANMISQRAQIGWSTHGHSAVDVNIYGTAGSDPLRGNHENIEVGRFLREYLNVSVDKINDELRNLNVGAAITTEKGWMGRVPTKEDIRATLEGHEKLYGKAP